MKFFPLVCGLAILFFGLTARSQEADLPRPDTQSSPTPSPGASASPLPSVPPPIISADVLALPEGPAAKPDVPGLSELDQGFNPAPLSPAAESQRQHIEWRRLRNAVQNDADIKAALRAAMAARKDLAKRQLLGRYYDLFYDRMIARAQPDMKSYLLDRKREAVANLPQPRVRPGGIGSKTEKAKPSPTVAPKR